MLVKVVKPDKAEITFGYDALGRRLWKQYKDTIYKFFWDGNVILHEYNEKVTTGKKIGGSKIENTNIITWIFKNASFTPSAKISGSKHYSIISDHIGTPCQILANNGNLVWERELDSYGKVRIEKGEIGICPFQYQGHYKDEETELCYNRFRYYCPEDGTYISKDPSGLAGGFKLYAYVSDPNILTDVFGLIPEYFPPDSLGRPTGGFAEVTPSDIGTGSDASPDIHPPGWGGGNHPNHHQRSHLIAGNHGGDGENERNLVTMTSGSNHPGMRRHEDTITSHVQNGNTVLVEVRAHYTGTNPLPDRVSMYAIDQNCNVIVDANVQNGVLQHHKACGCGGP